MTGTTASGSSGHRGRPGRELTTASEGQRSLPPPEDVGGAPGYEEFLEALADPDHEQHDDMVSWSGASFDPEDARIERIVERFDQLAKKWAPRPGKPKATKATP